MKNNKTVKARIKYLDIAKFIGIFCIYLGHFGIQAGYAFNFVFWFHVPLFFFLSGISENFSSNVDLKTYIVKCIKKIIFPFLIFAFLSIVVQTIYLNTYTEIIPSIIIILKGCIRNTFFAGSLWFLTCLFIVKIVFYVLKRLINNKIFVLLICFLIYLFSELIINPTPLANPRLFFNIDSAAYYIIYYAIGYYSLNIIKKLFAWDNKLKINISIILGLLSGGYTILLFFGKNIFSYFNTIKYLSFMTNLFSPLIVIVFILLLSRLITNFDYLCNVGENTLYLCGSEYFIKLFVPICLELIGLEIVLSNPITTYIYTLLLLIICNKYLVPIEKNLFKKLHII